MATFSLCLHILEKGEAQVFIPLTRMLISGPRPNPCNLIKACSPPKGPSCKHHHIDAQALKSKWGMETQKFSPQYHFNTMTHGFLSHFSLICISLYHMKWLYSPWNSPGQKSGVGNHSLLQGILPAQASKPGLPHCRWILYQLKHQGSPRILE